MVRRLLPAALAAGFLVLAVPAGATDRLSALQDRIAQAKAREDTLSAQIGDVTSQIQELDRRAGDVSARLAPLERDLALHRRQLDRLNELYRLQTRRFFFLGRQYDVAVSRLDRRLVAIYEGGEPGTLELVFGSTGFGQLLDQFEFARRLVAQDKGIARDVHSARVEVRAARIRTRHTRARVASITRTIEVRTEQVRALRDSLLAREGSLAAARDEKRQAATQTRESLKQMLAEADSLQQVSQDVTSKIQSASAPSTNTHPSASGLIWPVNGPVTSPFGYRCLEGLCRMHEGIDIGCPSGTPIHAAAAGTVVYAGWEGGYGNLTVIDHGGAIATAYGHQGSFAVSSGQRVSQGQVIGYSDCTGRCFGPHLHFEVRVNGSPVDPLGYL
jgi:murein DD-endopeptidase MepM/ murein hydrolase activator NlpD